MWYASPGPVSGSHHRLVVCRESGTGPSVTAPTKMGMSAIAAAVSTSPRVSASRMGSTSVAFSGQSTNETRFPPARASATAWMVSLSALLVTERA